MPTPLTRPECPEACPSEGGRFNANGEPDPDASPEPVLFMNTQLGTDCKGARSGLSYPAQNAACIGEPGTEDQPAATYRTGEDAEDGDGSDPWWEQPGWGDVPTIEGESDPEADDTGFTDDTSSTGSETDGSGGDGSSEPWWEQEGYGDVPTYESQEEEITGDGGSDGGSNRSPALAGFSVRGLIFAAIAAVVLYFVLD